MGRRRTGLIALLVAALGVMGSACQPAPVPQMKLTLDIDPAGTYEILTEVVTAKVRLSCTRPYSVGLDVVRPVGWGGVQELHSDRVQCPGPDGETFALQWKFGFTPTKPIPILMTATTSTVDTSSLFPDDWVERTPAIDLATTWDGESITFQPILCWPGAPACSPA